MTISVPPDDRLRECGDLRNRKTGMSLRTSGIRLLRHRTLRQQGIASYREGYGGPASAGVAGVVRLTRERHAVNDASAFSGVPYEIRWEYVCEYDLAGPARFLYFEGLFCSVFDSGQDRCSH